MPLLTALAVALAVPALAQQPQVAIAIRDRGFVPAEVQVPAGAKVELIDHERAESRGGIREPALHREKVVPPGATAISVYIGPLQPGRYEFFDDFHPATRGVVVVK